MQSGNKLISPEEQLIQAINESLRSTSLGVLRFLEAEAERRHWRCSYAQRLAHFGHWLDPAMPHAFDVRSLPNVIRVVGHADWLAALLALEAREMRARRANGSAEHEAGRARRW